MHRRDPTIEAQSEGPMPQASLERKVGWLWGVRLRVDSEGSGFKADDHHTVRYRRCITLGILAFGGETCDLTG